MLRGPQQRCCTAQRGSVRARDTASLGLVPRSAPLRRERGSLLRAISSPDDPGFSGQQQQLIGVDPSPPVPTKKAAAGIPLPLVALAAAAAAFGTFKLIKQRSRFGGHGDPFEREVLRNVNMVAVDELSNEAIAAARARRSRESAYLKMELEEVELPENHPWAVRKPVSEEQEAEITARLQVRRGVRRPADGAAGGRDAPSESEQAAGRRRRME
ncbi:MAG: hypothetical protein J3K34DRAFT_401343 [Monoraphidium minutum]|nr:MAG: hypothetical protein J3K34DRAFT_401343 [Monoraphidium minutum]